MADSRGRTAMSRFVIVNDDGYPTLTHISGEDDEYGCFVAFVEAGKTLDELVAAAGKHKCGEAQR
jgi:pimeloyl-CoA synthetase